MRKIIKGNAEFEPYRPWPAERRVAARARASARQGRELSKAELREMLAEAMRNTAHAVRYPKQTAPAPVPATPKNSVCVVNVSRCPILRDQIATATDAAIICDYGEMFGPECWTPIEVQPPRGKPILVSGPDFPSLAVSFEPDESDGMDDLFPWLSRDRKHRWRWDLFDWWSDTNL